MRNHDQLVAELMRRPGVRKEVERLEREAQKQIVAHTPTPSASDRNDAVTPRSTVELRARSAKRHAQGTGTKPQQDAAKLATLVRARLARGHFVVLDPKDL